MRSSISLLSLAIAGSLFSHAQAATPTSNGQDQAKQLGKIAVVADESAQSTVGNTTVVGAERLDQEQARNFEDAIRYIPGINIVDMGRFGDNGFNIRGLEGDRVALTVDGLSLGEAVETTPSYEFFRSGRGNLDIDSLKSIEVVKGADSITAGSGALGGAVVFTTKDPYDYLAANGNDSYFRVKTGYTSSSEEAMTTATLANRTGMIESMLIYTKRKGHESQSWYEDSPVTAGSQRRTPDPIDHDSDNLLAKVDFVLNNAHRFGVVGERGRSTNEINNLSRVGGLGYLTRRADDDTDRDRYGARYTWQNAGTFFDTLEWTADRQKTSSRGVTTITAASGCPRNIIPCLRSEDRSTEQVLDRSALDFTKAWSGGDVGHSLIYGVAWQQRDVDFVAIDTRHVGMTSATDSMTVDPAQVPKTDVTNISVYVRDSAYLLDDRLTLHAGARYDQTKYSPRLDAQFVDASGTVRDVDFAAPTWQAGADFMFVPDHSVWLQVGRGFRAPSVAEMYAPTSTSLAVNVASGAQETLWNSVANPGLESEESLNTEIGYRWESNRHRLGVSLFRDKYTNFIETLSLIRNAGTAYQTCVAENCTTTLGNEYTTPANQGGVTVKGVEVEGQMTITSALSARLAWSYSEGERKNGDPLPSIVPATGVIGLRYAAPSQQWSFAGNVTHAKPKKLKDATISSAEGFFEQLVPDYLSDSYTVLDLFGNINVMKNMQLTAGIYNVLDERYYQWPRVRFVNEGTTTLYGYVTGDGIGRYSEPDRNFRVSLAWQF